MGTVIISFDPIPNHDNIDDIKIINHLDIRSHDADLLPLRITLWHLKQIKRNCDNTKVFIDIIKNKLTAVIYWYKRS